MNIGQKLVFVFVIVLAAAAVGSACFCAEEVPVTVQKIGTNVVITLPAAAYDGAFEVLGVTNNAQKAEAIRRITRSGIRNAEAQARAKVEQRIRSADMNKLKTISEASK